MQRLFFQPSLSIKKANSSSWWHNAMQMGLCVIWPQSSSHILHRTFRPLMTLYGVHSNEYMAHGIINDFKDNFRKDTLSDK